MGAQIVLTTPIVSAPPGGAATAEVRIRNTGSVVDQFTCTVLGDAAAWASIAPASISLFPGAEGAIMVTFSPPRSSDVSAGAIVFGAMVSSQEDPEFSMVEEGTVQIAGFSAINAKIVPKTSRGKGKSEHRIEIQNTGNSTVTTEISAEDPDAALAFNIKPAVIELAPGDNAVVKLGVRGVQKVSGSPKRRAFSVTVDAGTPTVLDAAFEQHPGGGTGWLIWVAVAVVAAVLIYLVQDTANAAVLQSILG
ncbi:MAG: COG1470 family protein [Acidimicrobiales bacterium]